MELIIGAGFALVFLALGFLFGKMADQKHLADLAVREQSYQTMISTQSKHFLAPVPGKFAPTILSSETVIANDYFKRFLASFRSFFGGEIKSYNVLMERARRETILRILEQARAGGYNAICNLRLESADIGGNLSKQGMSIVCVLGTATAYHSGLDQAP